jgi:hypothetical protein
MIFISFLIILVFFFFDYLIIIILIILLFRGHFRIILLIGMFIWLFNDGLFHILYVDRPALFRLEPFTLLEAFNNEAKSGELAGTVAYNLGTWNAQGMFEIY